MGHRLSTDDAAVKVPTHGVLLTIFFMEQDLTAIPVVAGCVVRWRYLVAQTDSIASIHFADWRYANM